MPDPRNLEGGWLLDGDVSAQLGEPPRFTPKAAGEQRRRQAYAAKGTPLGGLSARCRPSAGQILNLGYDLFPAEIMQTPDKIVILNEEGRGRWRIFLERALPKQPTPSYSGHSEIHPMRDGSPAGTLTHEALGRPDALRNRQCFVAAPAPAGAPKEPPKSE